MLVDEARLASAIDHDHVVKVRELGFDLGDPFIVMDYVEGASLADVRKELSAVGRAIDSRFALRIALDALAGLHAAHVLADDKGKPLGLVHRDVSPHNLLIGCDGGARLTDFGIAKAADRVQHTRTHEVKGKLAYLAPERIDKRRLCTAQSDVFSMAVVLWECLAGRRLFRGEEALETLQEVLSAPIPSLRRLGVSLPQAVDAAILRGLSRDLDVRYKTADAFAEALRHASGGRTHIAAPAEIASLVEALFGDRLRVRHAQVREAIEDKDDAAEVLELSGLSQRPEPTASMRQRDKLAVESIAPTAPGDRYTFGNASQSIFKRRLASTRVRVSAALLACFAVLAILLSVRVRRGSALKGEGERSGLELLHRRVVVPLPFAAQHVTFDEQSRDFANPVDVAVFEVPRESGARHRVTAVASDGAKAEAYVREADGVARPEGEGFAIEALETYDEDASGNLLELPPTPNGVKRVIKPRASPLNSSKGPRDVVPSAAMPGHVAKPYRTEKDGFTKLR